MKKIFLFIFLSIFATIATGCIKGKDAEKDKTRVPFSIENRITELVEGATDDKTIQQELREELRFFIDQGYSNIGWVSIAYNPKLNDFEYRFEGDMGMSRFTLQEEMNRKFGIYVEDKKAPAEIMEVRDILYKLFEKLSRRRVIKEGVLPADCSKECRKVVYQLYPINQLGTLNNQFALVDFVVNKKTTNTLSISFEHLGFYTPLLQLQNSLSPQAKILNAEYLRVEFINKNGKWVMNSILLDESYENYMSGELYFPKDSLLSNR
jgi:hypothetical protein